ATQEIIVFVREYGRQHGYTFDHENTYSKMAVVNKSEYICQFEENGQMVWEATGSKFAQPYVFKKLFSKEPVLVEDYAIMKQVKSAIYLGDTFIGKSANVYASHSGDTMYRVTDNPKAGQPIVDKKTKEEIGIEPDKLKHAVTGTKGHLWKLFRSYSGKEDIDMLYYDTLVKDAIKSLESVGDASAIIDPFQLTEPRIDDEKVEIPF